MTLEQLAQENPQVPLDALYYTHTHRNLMTSTIPACKNCKHYYEKGTIGITPFCKFHTFERPDYINGHINKIDMIAFDARDSEKCCGREGKNFEEKEFVEEEEDISFWEYFKGFFTKSWMF